MYGPKGVGALYVRTELQGQVSPLIDGGGHERGLRSGTINTPGVVGLGIAAELAHAVDAEEAQRLKNLAARFYEALCSEIDGVELRNGPTEQRLPGNLNLRILGLDAEILMANCPQLRHLIRKCLLSRNAHSLTCSHRNWTRPRRGRAVGARRLRSSDNGS